MNNPTPSVKRNLTKWLSAVLIATLSLTSLPAFGFVEDLISQMGELAVLVDQLIKLKEQVEEAKQTNRRLEQLETQLKTQFNGLNPLSAAQSNWLKDTVEKQFDRQDRMTQLRNRFTGQAPLSPEYSQEVEARAFDMMNYHEEVIANSQNSGQTVSQFEASLVTDSLVETQQARTEIQDAILQDLELQEKRQKIRLQLEKTSGAEYDLAELTRLLTEYGDLQAQQGEAIITAIDRQTQATLSLLRVYESVVEREKLVASAQQQSEQYYQPYVHAQRGIRIVDKEPEETPDN